MNLKKKKNLASKTLGVGRERIVFLKPRLEEIKEAITRQDINDLYKDGAIKIKEVKGRKKVHISSLRKSPGKIKKRVKKRKKEYMIITRKLRKYSSGLKEQGKISKEELVEIRKKIRNRQLKNKSQLKEQLKTRTE
jgi:ribosomal protein L19E